MARKSCKAQCRGNALNMRPELKVTPIDISVDKKREVLGLENDNLFPVLLGGMGSLFLLALSKDGILHSFIPVLLTTSYVIVFKNKKPPHYKEDFFDRYLNGVKGFNLKGESSIKKKVYEI